MKAAFRLVAVGLVVVLLLAVMEVTVRVMDGFRLTVWPLTSVFVPAQGPPTIGENVRTYVRALPPVDGVRDEWFELSPAPLEHRPLTPDLADAARQVESTVSSDMFKQWNTRLIQEQVCGGTRFFDRFPGFAFSYEPADGSAHPPYRLLRSVATPYGLVTNVFGFRGREIAPDKPHGAIRIAFSGASTVIGSHGEPFSFPEMIEPWLNAWAGEHAPGVRFEVINAGREGIASRDIAAILRQEVLPLEPDLIVADVVANHFHPQTLVNGGPFPPPADLVATSTPLPVAHSALLRRVRVATKKASVGPGGEPVKPAHTIAWPAAVPEDHPNPDSPQLPLEMPQLVHDLDDMRTAAAAGHADLVVTSAVWMAKDGLVVDRSKGELYFDDINLKYWPVTYAEIRRLADFQNRVLRAYADARGLRFLDMAAQYPLDVSLFGDPAHMTHDGNRLRAWILFRDLLPILRDKLASGVLPAGDRSPLAMPQVPAKLPRTPTVCSDYGRFIEISEAVSAAGLHQDAGATITPGAATRVVTSGSRYGYAAEAQITDAGRVDSPGVVVVRVAVRAGQVSIGLLSRDRGRFLTSQLVDQGHPMADVFLSVPRLSDVGSVMISNASSGEGVRSTVDVEKIAVLVPPAAAPHP